MTKKDAFNQFMWNYFRLLYETNNSKQLFITLRPLNMCKASIGILSKPGAFPYFIFLRQRTNIAKLGRMKAKKKKINNNNKMDIYKTLVKPILI